MDWWRAKLVFIVAFLCLDALLVAQVRVMRLPVVPEPARRVLPLRTSAPLDLPVLQVETVGWQAGDEALLPGQPTCQQHLDPKQIENVLSETCVAAGGGQEIDWVGGVLQYTSNHGVPTGGRTSAGSALSALSLTGALGCFVRRCPSDAAASVVALALVERLDPSVGAQGWTSVASSDGQVKFASTEDYLGVPLFNGYWTVIVDAHGVTAQRWWLKVVGPVGPAQPVISSSEALAEAARLYTRAAVSAAGQAPELGYYAQTVEAPGAVAPWYIWPAYRIDIGPDQCVYIDAVAAGAGGADAGAQGAPALRPSPSGAGPLSPQAC